MLSPAEIIRSATTIGAQIVRMEGKLGCLKPGAFADLLVVDGNPLKNLELFQEQGRHLSVIMKGGRFHKNRLHELRCPDKSCSGISNCSNLRSASSAAAIELLVEGDTIKELSDKPIKAAEADVIDCGGRTLMPGLIDCHVHAIHSEVNVRFMEMLPLTLMTARAATRLRAMLDRGFTTVRDTGGADWGIKTAIETGHIAGPRLFIAGQSIGPTGGHSDSRRRTNSGGECVCCNGLQFKSADRRRRRRGPQIRARADAPGRRPRQDHDVGRRRLALRSARQPAILRRRSQRGGGRGDRLRPLCLRPCLFRRRRSPAPRGSACAPSSMAI